MHIVNNDVQALIDIAQEYESLGKTEESIDLLHEVKDTFTL